MQGPVQVLQGLVLVVNPMPVVLLVLVVVQGPVLRSARPM